MSLIVANGIASEPILSPAANGTTRVLPASSWRGIWPIEYPDSDGKPMSDNTRQGRWIEMLSGNLKALFRDRPDVFVASNLMWYAIEDEPGENAAPDVMLAFGRPKGDRGSYKQWKENDVPATVAFEILSPKNTKTEMDNKLVWYEDHGVEEYYVYDPDTNKLQIYQRGRAALVRITDIAGYVSRRMGIRFEMTTPEITVYRPNGERFLPYEDLDADREAVKQRADDEKRRADDEKRRADDEKRRADDEKRQADDEKRRADEAGRRESLVQERFARLAELAQKVRSGRATEEDLAEFERLATPGPG